LLTVAGCNLHSHFTLYNFFPGHFSYPGFFVLWVGKFSRTLASNLKIPLRTKIFWFLLILIVSLNVAIQITGNSYMYKALVYTYADIDDLDIFDTRKIDVDTPMKWPLSTTYNKHPLTDSLRKTLEHYKTVEFVIIHNDSLSQEEYWDHYDTNSISNSFSMAKSFVGTLIGFAVYEGKIHSIDDQVTKYLDWFKGPPLTVRQLLTMSAQLNWDEQYSSLWSVTTQAYYGSNLAKLCLNLHVDGTPGKVFNYQSGCTLLLAMIVEKATGKNVSVYASEKLWKPLGAEFPAQWSLDYIGGQEKAFCCIYSTARDFARLGQLYLDSGMWHGKQILSKQWVTESTAPAPLLDEDGKPNDCYGYQWWITSYQNHKIFYARGLSGQYIVVIPDKRLIFVRLGHKRGEPLPDHHLVDLDIYIAEVMKMYAAS
jgi:CubicO group peptidase (beta-lactamase class C family)